MLINPLAPQMPTELALNITPWIMPRQFYAALMLQALVRDRYEDEVEGLAKTAVNLADALIEALRKQPNDK